MRSIPENPSLKNKIREIAYGFRTSRILLTAFELDVFTVIESGMNKSDQIADKLKTDPRATDRLLNALCVCDLLEKRGDSFFNLPGLGDLLNRESPHCMLSLSHTNRLWSTWGSLTQAVSEGGAPEQIMNTKNEGDIKNLIEAMQERGAPQAKEIISLLDLKEEIKLLDVGGGSGIFSVEFLKNHPGMRATILDFPYVVNLAKEYVNSENLNNRVSYIEGNYHEAEFGQNYDLILLSAVIHINSLEQNKKLISKCAGALKEEGVIIIKDFVMNEDRITPADGALFALNMLVNTERGDTYTESEIRQWLLNAGVKEIQRIETESMSGLIIGKGVLK